MTFVLLNIIRLPCGRYSGKDVKTSSLTSPRRYIKSLDWSRGRQREFSNTFIRKRITVFTDMDMSRIFFHCFLNKKRLEPIRFLTSLTSRGDWIRTSDHTPPRRVL